MNYGRAGIRQRQKALNSATTRMGKSIGVIIFQVVVFCAVAIGVIGLCGGIGLFMGVIETAPDVTDVDVSPAGFSTSVYDNKGNLVTKLIAENSNRIYVTLDKIPEHTQHSPFLFYK